jgi:ATP-dependent helicase/nuclease subunit A
MSTVQLTPSQQSALDLQRHTAIIANAGSGKTRVLVERYLKILESDHDLHPRNIAAITFTDASARDLKKKITEAVLQRLNDSTGEEGKRLLEIRQQLPGAAISTIHSFCIQLLRTYPVEANVDASFTILASPEDQLLREECVQSTFYRILKSAYANEHSAEAKLLPAFRLFGRRRIASLIHSFLLSRFRVKNLIDSFYKNDNAAILSFWNEQIDSVIQHEILPTIDISFFTRLLDEKTKMGIKRQEAEEAVEIYSTARSDFDKLRGYAQLIDAFYTDKIVLNGNLFYPETKEKYNDEAEAAAAPYVKYKNFTNSTIELHDQANADELYLEYCRQLLEIYERSVHYYSEQKIHYSFLDYDDVIEKAMQLVQDPDVSPELVRRYAHILIDEYQDTDAAQYEIVRALTGKFQEENRLTIVGDPKQSIYSFRNADLDLYFKTNLEISSAHEDNKPVILSETFRMLAHPLAFINRVSEHLFPNDPAHGSEYTFTPLVEGRNNEKTGTVEFILPPKDDKPLAHFIEENSDDEEEIDYDPVSASEVELIARKIQQIIADPSGEYRIPKGEKLEPARYNDIAILLRSRTHQSELESALRAKDIPFVTYGGTGFYSQPEIIDITNYLRFLVNPNDDIALAGVLRSPYFAFSDVDLYRLVQERSSISNLWQKLTPSIDSSEYFLPAYNQLSENLQLVGRVSTQFLLQKIIRESGILGILQSLPDREQKIANLEKFQRFALATGSEGYSGTFDFIERISLLMERDEAEAQAEPQSDLNAVHIMTIHNAKGLEFPIVFLPYLHSRLRVYDARKVWNTLDKELGIGIGLPDQTFKQPIVELIKLRRNDKDDDEEKRIFYVAMTRARDHLVLSASHQNNYTKTRMGWVLESLGEDPQKYQPPAFIPLTTEIDRYRIDEPITTTSVQFHIPVYKDIPEVKEVKSTDDTAKAKVHFLLKDIEPSETIGRYSPSQLLTFLECETKYYLRYQLGLPEESRLPYFNEADILAENVQGSLFGQILHKVLERADQFFFGDVYDEKLLDDVFHSVANEVHLTESERAAYHKRLLPDMQNIFTSPIGRQALQAKSYHTELSLRAKLSGGQILSGIIDRLYCDESGLWNILDYKTDTRENKEKKKRYEFQMKFYAYLVSLMYSQDRVNTHVLYTHSGNTISFNFTKKHFSEIGAQLQSLVAKIKLQKKMSSLDEPARNLSHCPECSYFDQAGNICIAGAGNAPIALQTELFFS